MPDGIAQLVSYIAPAAPATRRLASGDEPFLRPEIGFTPAWFRQHLSIDFGRPWHLDPQYRLDAVIAMRKLLRVRFPETAIGRADRPNEPLDLLTGLFGACSVAAVYGLPIVYAPDNWPDCEHQTLTDEEVDTLVPPDLDTNPHFQQILGQVDWIAARQDRVEGSINWQGVLNNAQRLRGQQLFVDMLESPERATHLFECVCQTMLDAVSRLHARQRQTGVEPRFFTVSNCLVNMVSPVQYEALLLPLDRRLAEAFPSFGIHNCAWNANPYLSAYASLPNVAYVDMGLNTDLRRARELFPRARRAVMYTPMDLARKSLEEIRQDFARIARQLGPCDVVLADIEAGTPDTRVLAAVQCCEELSRLTPPTRQGPRTPGSGRISSRCLPRGIISVVQTPFDSAGGIDVPSLERLVNDAILAGVDGLLAPVVASEVAWLSPAERREVVQRIAGVAAGRVPLIVGASDDLPETCRSMAELGEGVGAEAYLVAVPSGLYRQPEEIVPFFRAVTTGSRLPLIVQDFQFNGPGLSLDVIRELADSLPHLVGLKIETVPAGPKYTAVRDALGSEFFIAGGWAVMQMIEALDRGVDAMIPESSMIRVYQAILREHSAGRRNVARNIFHRFLPILAFTNQEIATSVAFFKRLLVRKGIFTCDALRMPGFSWDPYNDCIAHELIEHYLALECDVGHELTC